MEEEIHSGAQAEKSVFLDRYEWVSTLISTVVFMILVFAFLIRTNVVFGISMLPTLTEEDVLFISRVGMEPKAGDIVVITKPNENEHSLIKRVIATEGQTVDIDFQSSEVYVDGILLDEPYINAPTRRSFDVFFPVVVPEGHVFVMGDNRNNSLDSRDSDVGMIDTRYILGRAFWRVLPADDFGAI